MGDMPKFVGVNYLRWDDTFFVRVNQGVLDEAKEIIMFVHDCLKEKMEEEANYEQVPQILCKWCSYWKGNGGPCDAEIPAWKPKFGARKKYTKDTFKNATLDDDSIQTALNVTEEGEKNKVWDD